MGIRAGTLAMIAVGIAIAVLAANAPAPSAGARQASGTGGSETSTVTYSGALQSTVQLVDSSGQVNEILSQDYTWKATWTGPTNLISDQSGRTLGWTSVSLSGSDSIQYPDSTQGPGQSQNCADSLSAATGQTFNAILPYGGNAITFALNTISPRQTPTQGGGCFMSPRLACPPGSVPNEQNGTYCSPDPAWKFKAGAKTFTIASNYGPTNVGGKIVTSDLTSSVSASGTGCPLSSSPSGAADRAHADTVPATVAQTVTLHIEDLIHGGNIDRTSQRVATGSHVRLMVACGLGPPDHGSVQWSIAGLSGHATTSSAIKDVPARQVTLQIPDATGQHLIPTNPPDDVHVGRPPRAISRHRDLSSPSVDFYFIQPGKWHVKVKARYNGRSLSASVTYYVVKPNPRFEPVHLGRARVYTTPVGYRLGLTGLDPANKSVGLRYGYQPSINRHVGPVSYALFQLITASESGTGFHPFITGPSLDTCVYQTLAHPDRHAFVTTNTPGAAALAFTDGPNMPLSGPSAGGLSQGPTGRARLNVTLDTFLLVVPVGGVPVALGDTRMNFVARARKIGHIWSTIPQPRPTIHTTIYPNRVRFVPGWPDVLNSSGVGCVGNPRQPPNG